MPSEDKFIDRMRTAWMNFSKDMSSIFINSRQEQAISVHDLALQAWIAVDAISDGVWYWLVDAYIGDKEMFAVFASGGKLYKVDLQYENDKVFLLGDLQEVVVDFNPVSQSLSLVKQADGSTRCFLIAGTTVMNRNGGLNSQQLYDSFIEALPKHEQPYIDFFHLGKEFNMGTVDLLQRDQYTLIASFVFDDSKLSQYMIQAIEAEPEFWGSSIAFYPTKQARLVDISDGIRLPCHDEGWLESITILPEQEARCLFTAVIQSGKEVNVMDARVLEAIKKIAGDDEEFLNDLTARVDKVNQTVDDENLIHQSAEDELEEEEVVEGTEGDSEEAGEEVPEGEGIVEDSGELVEIPQAVVEVTDEVLARVADAFADSEHVVSFMAEITGLVGELKAEVGNLTKELNEMRASNISYFKKADERFGRLELTEEDKQRQWVEDLPASPKLSVTYRPREEQSAQGEKSFNDVAAETLATLK